MDIGQYPAVTTSRLVNNAYRKISPSMYKPLGGGGGGKGAGLYLEIAIKYKVKQSKNGKFPSNYKASPIDFETQISLRR